MCVYTIKVNRRLTSQTVEFRPIHYQAGGFNVVAGEKQQADLGFQVCAGLLQLQ